ncbi:hypothetical protein [Spirosoma montaniterrae]|uniref:DUF5683 domain-containing protein n=1 Tax=Spirosoma montaniterrae TaxID=1178516 RepID=A0A1P9X077_9BACT|nr:hypothetical protein [Spirosoma montaniterrae]AQG81036.1 hypothetical protein AWR27_17945 [Spirosoma montaniterrae]
MKRSLFAALLVSPLAVLAQTGSLPLPLSDSLKPIQFREIPITYGNRSWVSTAIQRTYTYDGIDVQDPERELWPVMLKLNDPDVEREHIVYNQLVRGQREAGTLAAIFFWPGLVALTIGAVQADSYDRQLRERRNNWYQQPAQPVTTTQLVPDMTACGAWIGTGNGNGTFTYTCQSGPHKGYRTTVSGNATPAVMVSRPVTTAATFPVGSPPTELPNIPNGRGLMIGGTISMCIGLIAALSGPRGRGDSFLRAVQYYNRALKQKVSWEIRPYSTLGMSGASLVVRF